MHRIVDFAIQPDSKKLSGRITGPDSDYIKADTADIMFRECVTEAEKYIVSKGAIALTERKIGKSRIDREQSKA